MADIQEYSVSIKFDTKGTEKTTSDTDKIKNSIDKLKTSTKSFDGLKTGLSSVTSFAGKATTALKAFAVAGATALIKLGKTAMKYEKEMADYIETVNLFRTSMGSLSQDAEEFRDKAQNLLGMDPQVTMDAISSFQNLSEGFGIASDRAYIMSKNLTQLSGDLSSFANISFADAQQKLMSGFSGQVMPLRKYGIALDQASLQETAYALGIDKKVKSMTRAQKTELIYYQIMKSTQKMQGDLGKTLMSPANALRVLQTEFKSLGRAVGSIFIPLVQRIIPIMRAVTKALTSAAQAIAQFFGFDIKNYTVEISDTGTAFGGMADDIEDVGGAAEGTAKKLNKMLMPFDELNNITSSTGSGSGSGYGSDIGGGSLGIDLPEYDMFANIDDRYEKFENVLEGAKRTAEKINELMAQIPWTEIKATVGTAGENIAKFLNVGIENIDWQLAGKTLGEGINTIIELSFSFVETLNWKGLGDAISGGINGAIETIDFAKSGKTLGDGIKGLLTTTYTALEGTDWIDLGKKVREFFNNIDWNGIFDSLSRSLGAAVGGIGAFIVGFIMEDIAKAISFFAIKIQENGGDIGKGILEGIGEIFINIGNWINDHIFQPFITGFKNIFGIHSPSTVMAEQGHYIIQGLINGIESFIGNIKDTWETIKTTILGKIEEIKTNAEKIFSGLWKAIVKGAEVAVNFVIDGINKMIGAINIAGEYLGFHLEELSHVQWADDYAREMGEMYETTDETMNKINSTTTEQMQNMTSFLERNSKAMSNGVISGFNTIQNGVDRTLETTQQTVEKKTTRMQYLISVAFQEAEKNSRQSIEGIKTGVQTGFEGIANSSVFSRVKASLHSALDNAVEARRLGSQTASSYQEGINNTVGSGNIANDIFWRIRNIFNLGDSAYWWGKDLIDGFKRGIEATKNTLENATKSVANVITKYLHFSKPDVGPLREYETWMPDMIKGLSDSLIKATPILDNAVSGISDRLANSMSNIITPDINQSIFVNQNASQLIGNIGNKTNNASKDNTTANMIKATYDAVSRALIDNTGNEERQPIIINFGNKELYRGYAQYRDEQSNILGVTI